MLRYNFFYPSVGWGWASFRESWTFPTIDVLKATWRLWPTRRSGFLVSYYESTYRVTSNYYLCYLFPVAVQWLHTLNRKQLQRIHSLDSCNLHTQTEQYACMHENSFLGLLQLSLDQDLIRLPWSLPLYTHWHRTDTIHPYFSTTQLRLQAPLFILRCCQTFLDQL